MAKMLSGYAGPTFPADDPEPTRRGQPYQILTPAEGGGFTGSGDAGQQSHAVSFCVPWAGLGPFLAYITLYTGTATTTPAGGGGPTTSIVRNLPMQSPFAPLSPLFTNTYCTGWRFRPGGLDTDVTNSRLYADMIVDVTFGTIPFALGDGSEPWLVVSGSGSSNYNTVPDAQLQFDNGESIDHDYGILVGQQELRFEWPSIPDLADALNVCVPMMGQVNSDPVTLDGRCYAAGYLLYVTQEYQHTNNPLGQPTARLALSVTYRSIPWNSDIASDGKVHAVTPAPYQTTPFAPLLQIG